MDRKLTEKEIEFLTELRELMVKHNVLLGAENDRVSFEWEQEPVEELDVHFINGTDEGKKRVAVSRMKAANSKEVFVEITNENRGKVTFQ